MADNRVHDIVAHWSESLMNDARQVHTCTVQLGPNGLYDLIFAILLGNGQRQMFALPIIVGVPEVKSSMIIGSAPTIVRWGIARLGPGVWKPTPSFLHPNIHCFLTLVGVPEPAPFLPIRVFPPAPAEGGG